MNLYIFEDVLTDYTSGMVVIAATTLDEALGYARSEYGVDEVDPDFGWGSPTGVYPVSDTVVPGIRHEVYGGS